MGRWEEAARTLASAEGIETDDPAGLLAYHGPYLGGDPAGQGERQVTAISTLTRELDPICQSFRVAIFQGSRDMLRQMAGDLWLCLDMTSQYKLMLELGSALLNVARVQHDDELLLLGLLGQAMSLRRLGNLQEATPALQQAVELARTLGRSDLEARALRLVAQCLIAKGETAEGRRVLDEARQLSSEQDDQPGLAAALNQLGVLEFELGNYPEARAALERAVDLQRVTGSLELLSRCLSNLALLETRAHNLDAATELYQRSLQLKERLHDRRGSAVCLGNLGSVASARRDHAGAQSYLEEALLVAREIGDKPLQATLLSNLGMVARERQDYMLAATRLSVALELHRETNNRLGEGVTLRFMAIVSQLADDARQAAEYLADSLEIYRGFGALREVAISAGLAGVLLVRQGDLRRGAALLHAANELEQQHGFNYEADVRDLIHEATGELDPSVYYGQTASGVNCEALAQYALTTLRERFGAYYEV